MALIYQPSKRIFCGWFEPLKSTTYSEYPKKVTDDVSKVSQDDAALVLKMFLLSKIKEDEE